MSLSLIYRGLVTSTFFPKLRLVAVILTVASSTTLARDQMEDATKPISDTASSEAPDSRPEVVGKALRAAIDAAYQQAKESKAIYANDPNGVDTSDVVRQYIVLGQRVESTKAILLEAGFVFGEDPQSAPGITGAPQRTLIGYLEPLEKGILRRYHTKLRIVVKATDTVNEVHAAFQFPTL